MNSSEPHVAVIQPGDRLNYRVPLAMQRAGVLESVFTDWYSAPGRIESALNLALKVVSRSRHARWQRLCHPELQAWRVHSKPSLILRQSLWRRRYRKEIDHYSWMADAMAQWVLDFGLGDANLLFGWVRSLFPGLAATARAQGIQVVVDQMTAPFAIEQAEERRQHERFPGWAQHAPWGERDLIDFERGTWESADLMTCGSDYVREGLIGVGVDASRVAVVPYPVDAGSIRGSDRRSRFGPITVGFVGDISLRKGTPYFLQVAKQVDPAKAKFVMVGPICVERAALHQHHGAVAFPGPADGQQTREWLAKFDVLLFPSACGDAAQTTADAMLAALPVITSPNAGSIVRHGVDGFVTAYDDVDGMADYVTRLADDANLRQQMGASARLRAESVDTDFYGQRMKELFQSLLK